jgi:16S rRNA processing protein RimM
VSAARDREPPATIVAGLVGRPHGLDGGFYVTHALSRLLREGVNVWLDGRQARIVRRAGVDERPILRIEGVGDRSAAQALRGTRLLVRRAQAPALDENEWWAIELEGCSVVDGERHVGTVQRLLELPSCEALEVKLPGGGEPLLVPMVSDAIRSVDVAARRIEVDMSFVEGE